MGDGTERLAKLALNPTPVNPRALTDVLEMWYYRNGAVTELRTRVGGVVYTLAPTFGIVTDLGNLARQTTQQHSPVTVDTEDAGAHTINDQQQLAGMLASSDNPGHMSPQQFEKLALLAPALQVAEGSYIGDGVDPQTIVTNFEVKFVEVIDPSGGSGQDRVYIRTKDMTFCRKAVSNAQSQEIDDLVSGGFKVSGLLNTLDQVYYYKAYGGENCKAGTYTATAAPFEVLLNAKAKVVIVVGDVHTYWRTDAMSGDSNCYILQNYIPTPDALTDISATGFSVGPNADVNTAAVVYPYVALLESDNLATGYYTGDGTDNRNQPDTALAMDVDAMWLKAPTSQACITRQTAMGTDDDDCYTFNANAAADCIQSLVPVAGKFQVGTGRNNLDVRFDWWAVEANVVVGGSGSSGMTAHDVSYHLGDVIPDADQDFGNFRAKNMKSVELKDQSSAADIRLKNVAGTIQFRTLGDTTFIAAILERLGAIVLGSNTVERARLKAEATDEISVRNGADSDYAREILKEILLKDGSTNRARVKAPNTDEIQFRNAADDGNADLVAKDLVLDDTYTKSIWIPQNLITEPTAGTASIVMVGSSPNYVLAWRFPEGQDAYTGLTWQVPSDWASGAVDVIYHYVLRTTDTGDVVFRLQHSLLALGDDIGETGTNVDVVDTPGGTFRLHDTCVFTAPFTPGATGEIWRLNFARLGTGGSDTYPVGGVNGDVDLFGVEIQYTAKKIP